MRIKYLKTSIQIIPECDQDEVYLESVLNIKKKDDIAEAKRVSPFGLDLTWAYLEIKAVKP